MDRMVEEIGGFYPTHPEWDWLWSSMTFTPDMTSNPPADMGGWCHGPIVGERYNPVGDGRHSTNAFGPAMRIVNDNNPNAYGSMWTFTDQAGGFGTVPVVREWSLAFGIDKRGPHYGIISIVTLRVYLQWVHKISYNWTTERLLYQFGDFPAVAADFSPLAQTDTPCTVVITSKQMGNISIYANGIEVGSDHAGGTALFAMGQIQIGGNAALKQPRCWGGTIGPFVMTRHAWSPTEVAQWSADPSGFLRPAYHPIPIAEGWADGDFSSELASDAELSSELASDGTLSSELAADGELSSELAADGDFSSEIAADGDFSADQGV